MRNAIARRVTGAVFFSACLLLFQNCGPAKVSTDAASVPSSGNQDLGSSDPGSNSPPSSPTPGSSTPTPTPVVATPTPDPVMTPTPAPTGPMVSLSRTAIDFGSVDFLSSSPTQTVTLTNTGDATLTISKAMIGSDFSFANNVANSCGSSLAPGASCAIGMRFSPPSPGDETAMARITTNAPDSPHLIQLSGKGRL